MHVRKKSLRRICRSLLQVRQITFHKYWYILAMFFTNNRTFSDRLTSPVQVRYGTVRDPRSRFVVLSRKPESYLYRLKWPRPEPAGPDFLQVYSDLDSKYMRLRSPSQQNRYSNLLQNYPGLMLRRILSCSIKSIIQKRNLTKAWFNDWHTWFFLL